LAEALKSLETSSVASLSVNGTGDVVTKRKQDRNAREQKRSLKISQQIGHLKEVLESDGMKVKNSKMAILVSVERYIKELEGEISQMTLNRGAAPVVTNEASSSSSSNNSWNGTSSSSPHTHTHTHNTQIAPPLETVTIASQDQEVANGVGYQSLFKQVSTPLAVASMDGRFVDANMRFEMATGYSKEGRCVCVFVCVCVCV
jgi:hypothetical protein